MATHKLSILVEAIGAGKAAKDLKGVDKSISNIGSRAGQGVRNAGANLVKIGAVAAAGIGVAVKTGLSDLAELEDAVTSVDGAIAQVAPTWKVTGAEIAGIANRIESEISAAFDDKEIVAGTSGLIRYGKVAEANLPKAMQVMTDLAAKTGSVESASTILAKALADPEKAAGKLNRMGVVLTKQQQKQIKAMVKAGDVAGAQTYLLDQLAKTTEGAALASQGPYQRALSVMEDVTEDARKALAEGFLPVITKVADLLSDELAKPGTMDNIRDFGNTLASGLDDLVEIARNLPWQQIGDSMKLAGAGAKTILGAFSSLPSWVQTAVLTGWGLNKLTGGALGGIAGELGKGLIKGVLGMNAGVVNIKAGVVNGGGAGLPGKGGAGAAGAAGVGLGTLALGGAALAAVSAAIAEGANRVFRTDTNKDPGFKAPQMFNPIPALQNIAAVLGVIRDTEQNPPTARFSKETNQVLARVALNNQRAGERNVESQDRNRARTTDAIAQNKRETTRGLNIVKATAQSGLNQNRQATATGLMQARAATQTAGTQTASATRNGSAAIVRALYATRTQVNVTSYNITKNVTSASRGGGSKSDRYADGLGRFGQ